MVDFSSSHWKEYPLLSTKNMVIVEASPSDKVWGIGLSMTNKDINDPKKWKGKNLLGKCLMNVRTIFKKISYDDFVKEYYQ